MTGWLYTLLAQAAPPPSQGTTAAAPTTGAPAQPPGPSATGMFLILGAMFVIMYVLMIRPQQKKQKEHQEMLKKLKVGDRVVTTGGLYGVISAVKDKSFQVKVAENVKVEVARGSVVGLGEESDASDEAKKKS